jgi:CubicO group peptidase (beta-lactamase class C family)
VLLGAAVEKVTTEPLPEYLQVKVFGPLGMKKTFVLTSETLKTRAVAKGYSGFGDLDDYDEFVTGDGGMYSTVEDLYLFDRALYDPAFAPSAQLDQMFTPTTVRVGTTIYGLGWNIEELPSGKRVWHTGNTGGFRAYFERRIEEHGVIIMLTNLGNSRRVEISAAIEHILKGEPFLYPKRSSAVALYEIFQKSGIDATLAAYRTYKSKPSDYDVSESEINTLGYQVLYHNKKPRDAIRIFALNTQEHPESSNAFDSLAEAYKVSGDTKTAKQDYERALQLDSTNVHARTALAQLK